MMLPSWLKDIVTLAATVGLGGLFIWKTTDHKAARTLSDDRDWRRAAFDNPDPFEPEGPAGALGSSSA